MTFTPGVPSVHPTSFASQPRYFSTSSTSFCFGCSFFPTGYIPIALSLTTSKKRTGKIRFRNINSLDGNVTDYRGFGDFAESACFNTFVTASGSNSNASFLYGPYNLGMNFCS